MNTTSTTPTSTTTSTTPTSQTTATTDNAPTLDVPAKTSTPVPNEIPDASESYSFSADISQLMSLIINTFYSNKEIFLRELISNSSDALDKIRYQSLTDPTVLESEPALRIRLTGDKANNTIIIEDTGIGMTREELVTNLGTIAKSGTKGFMEAVQAGADLSMIGQFGVGFYSAYLVADRVRVYTRHNEESQTYLWESSAGGSFTVTPTPEVALTRGTRMELHLKEDQGEFLEETRLRELVKTHSQYINFPIELFTTREKDREVTDSEEEEETPTETPTDTKTDTETTTETTETTETPTTPTTETTETDKVTVEDVTDETSTPTETETKRKTKTVKEVTTEWTHLNTVQPVWTKKPEDVTSEEHEAFYKSLSNDWETHANVKHFRVEGGLEFTGLLYLPKRAPFDLFNKKTHQDNIKLYVRRVFIMDDCPDLMPEYLGFVKGVVDSEDLPLNISRETLQQNRIMRVMKKHLVKRSLEMFQEMSEDKDHTDDYMEFYKNFGKNLKLGIHEDSTNRDRLASLLRYQTSTSGDDWVSLDTYIERMPESQKEVYYITGESRDSVSNSPFLERLTAKGYEVLYLVEAIDEYAVQQLKTYKEKTLTNITKAGLVLEDTEEEKKTLETLTKDHEALCQKVQSVLGERVEKVVVSTRMTDSPCCLVTGEYGWTANMERIMKSQALGDTQNQSYMMSKRTMELNPDHRIVRGLRKRVTADPSDPTIKDLVWLLFETSVLTGGFTLDQPTTFAGRIHRLVELGLGDDDDEEDSLDPSDTTTTTTTSSPEDDDDLPPLEDTEDTTDNTMEEVD